MPLLAGTTKPLKHAVVDTATSGDNTIVAAVSGRLIKVAAYVLVASGAVSARWKSGAGTNRSGAMSLVNATPLAAPGGFPTSLFETAAGAALVLNLSAAVQVSGHVTYWDSDDA